ncbi:Tripartite tricarboxylate transporter TctA family [Pannonibacter phragmitetus]|uniref:Tripartite tricarboxylate transporter TctA family n=1 Tax=Pannonibacter phragmitetus TaxID=121719 RepID=A0A378ZQL8_9HYPH|nr:tripartite tricarboxylate transporter permease [Pannonibacter phragmitetus]SUA99552.1 Tripartite tricarboxylate transporter TctA family [Pannonibacter phragmitetus]
MIDTLLSALGALLSFQHLFYMLIGVSVGLVIGVIPGLGGIAGLSLLIPFLYGMNEISALAMLIGLVAVIPTSDTFSSVLMGIPGSSASQATVLDGFPLARQGQAARALSAAFISSMAGGVFGAVVLTGFVVIARPLILSFGSAELFMLALFGLSMVAVLAGRSLAKGLAACCIGLIIGSIGGAPATGEFRMIFGFDYLYDGIPLVIIGLGFFAIPEIADLLRKNSAIASGSALGSGWFQGFRDWWGNLWLSMRCSGLGCIIGAIPGLGGSVVDWIAYGHAVQTVKKDPQFGKGDIRGVIAPESANNAMQGGALLPTMLFGIPGSGAMAVFLGGMVLLGIQPGPSMVGADLNITYSVIWSLALANVMGAGICLALAIPISRLTQIPFQRLAPFMIVLICFAAFQATRSLADLVALLCLGVLGVLMKRFGWPRPALLIGYVLAPQAETYLYQALQFNGWDFVFRPGVIVIAVMTLASIWFGLRNRIDEHGHVVPNEDDAPDVPSLRAHLPQITFAVAMAGALLIALNDALKHDFLAQVFPLSVSIIGLVMLAILIPQLVRGKAGHHSHFDAELTGEHVGQPGIGSLWGGLAWIGGLVGLTALIGFYAALLLFFPFFLIVRARAGLLATLLMTAGAAGIILILAWALSLNFPSGMLQDAVDLPWPFR